jgi:hypothetical protein
VGGDSDGIGHGDINQVLRLLFGRFSDASCSRWGFCLVCLGLLEDADVLMGFSGVVVRSWM